MASWKVTTRNVNKGVAQPLVVRYSHPNAAGKNEDWFVPVGFSIDPALLKNQRVVGDATAPEINEQIQRVVTRLERAVRAASSSERQPYKKAVQAEYAREQALPAKACRLVADIKAHDESELGKLEAEIELLVIQLEEKRAKVIDIKKRQGTHQPELLATLIDQYVESRKAARPKNATGKRKGSFSKSLEKQYKHLKDQLAKYNPALSIRDIDKAKLYVRWSKKGGQKKDVYFFWYDSKKERGVARQTAEIRRSVSR